MLLGIRTHQPAPAELPVARRWVTVGIIAIIAYRYSRKIQRPEEILRHKQYLAWRQILPKDWPG